MIVGSEEDALRFMEAEGVCGVSAEGSINLRWCSGDCMAWGAHVASTDVPRRVFATDNTRTVDDNRKRED